MSCDKKLKKGVVSILGVLVLGVILIYVLSYFKVNIEEVVESPEAQENIEYVGGKSKSFWDKYLKDPAHYLWQDVWVNIFWKSFILNMERIRDGKPTDLDKSSPTINFENY